MNGEHRDRQPTLEIEENVSETNFTSNVGVGIHNNATMGYFKPIQKYVWSNWNVKLEIKTIKYILFMLNVKNKLWCFFQVRGWHLKCSLLLKMDSIKFRTIIQAAMKDHEGKIIWAH